MDRFDRYRGCLLGGAAGDALGYEIVRAVAQAGPDLVTGGLGEAEFAQRVVHAVRQVVQRVQQRAVQIKNNSVVLHNSKIIVHFSGHVNLDKKQNL